MPTEEQQIYRSLRRQGLSRGAINAAWPRWWSEEAAKSPSAKAELRFTLARRLGFSPKPFAQDGRAEFVWRDHARFKHLRGESDRERNALAAFGESVSGALFASYKAQDHALTWSASQLRSSILARQPLVDLGSLLALCWAVGIPVIYLRVFPLQAKAMHAMVSRSGNRHAILIGRDALYPAPVAFTLAHELGHIICGHLSGGSASLLEIGDLETGDRDAEELEADRFALELLTGRAEPNITTNFESFNSRELASAVISAGREYRIEPGTLALCLAHKTSKWALAQSALRYVYSSAKPVWTEVNRLASKELEFEGDRGDFLRAVMGLASE